MLILYLNPAVSFCFTTSSVRVGFDDGYLNSLNGKIISISQVKLHAFIIFLRFITVVFSNDHVYIFIVFSLVRTSRGQKSRANTNQVGHTTSEKRNRKSIFLLER